ncbi:MAG: hypothetical protein M3Q56_10005 [Bacteroidota bacterium]|nr:hypothetical protein [Bacteroidota bacterium]
MVQKLIYRISNKLFPDFLECRYYASFFKNVTTDETQGRQQIQKSILIYSGIGSMYLTPVEILLYHLLRAKGFQIDYYIYDESNPANEVITKERREELGKDFFWRKSVKRAKNILTAAKVKYSFIEKSHEVNRLLENENADLPSILNFTYDQIHFGDIVRNTLYRYYKSTNFGTDVLERAEEFLETSLINYCQIQKLAKFKTYSYVLCSHGIYCTWAPIIEFCIRNKIKYICYDRAKTLNHCNFNLNLPSPVWDFSSAWNRWKDRKLTTQEELQVDQYLGQRIFQKGDVYQYNFSAKEIDITSVRQRLNIPEGNKVITLFTNLIWDAANVSRDIAFTSMLECIIQTVTYFKDRTDVTLLLRTHPAEQVLGTNEGYSSLVREKIGPLPQNVLIIDPEMKLNSFTIIELSDVGIVHTSTVGLEMAIEGKAVILISDTHYRNKGFTYDVSNAAAFFEVLEQLILNGTSLKNQQEIARKYFFMMMFRYQHLMPMQQMDQTYFPTYNFEGFEELKSTMNSLNRIVDRIADSEEWEDFIFDN